MGSIKEMSVLIPKWEILDRLVKKIGGSSIFVKYKYIRTSSIFYDADYNTLYKLKVASVYMDESYEEMNINESGLNSSHYILPIGKIITPTVCKSLTITAEDVQWYDT